MLAIKLEHVDAAERQMESFKKLYDNPLMNAAILRRK